MADTNPIDHLAVTLHVHAVHEDGTTSDQVAVKLNEADVLTQGLVAQACDRQLLQLAAQLRGCATPEKRTRIEDHISEILTLYVLAGNRLANEPF